MTNDERIEMSMIMIDAAQRAVAGTHQHIAEHPELDPVTVEMLTTAASVIDYLVKLDAQNMAFMIDLNEKLKEITDKMNE